MVQKKEAGLSLARAIPVFRQGMILFLLSGLLTSCFKNDIKEVEKITQNRVPAEVATDIEAIYSDSAKVRADLKAPEMIRTITKDPTIEMPKGLHVIFYKNILEEETRLRADYGIRYINTGLTRVSGDVQVSNAKGDTLNTEELFWSEPKQKIYSQKLVKVKTKSEIIIAEGFESDVGFNDYTFYKVRGRVPLPK